MLTVAIVGRPNVGKSTLFNRLAGKRLALVHDTPGVTRDRREAEAQIGARRVRIVDTAGLEDAAEESLQGRMRQMTDEAVAAADLCLFVLDARAGVTPFDEHYATLLRKAGKPVVVVANKCEGEAGAGGFAEAFALGLGEPVAISAEHAHGLSDLADAIEEVAVRLGADHGPTGGGEEDDANRPLRLAIVGRPNVGKSTLVNRLIGEERLLTGPESGITRDAIAVDWFLGGRAVKLYDTAGMRRRARVTGDLEKLSVGDTLRAIRFAEVVVVVLDATQALEKQDAQIAELVVEEGRALVLALNKWDLVEDRPAVRRMLGERLEILLPQASGVALVPLSGLTGEGLPRLGKAILSTLEVWSKRVPTGELNRWLAEATERHQPPAVQGRPIRLRYITQAKARPPTFILFTSRPDALPDSYLRYLTNELRDAFSLPGVPIRITLRKPRNPYAERK